MRRQDYYSADMMRRYDPRPGERRLERREIESLAIIKNNYRQIDRGRFLDVGSGDGVFLKHVSESFSGRLELYGGDVSSHQIELASKQGSFSISFLDLAVGMNYPDAHFDFLYSGEVIEHLYDPDLMLREIYRVLVPGGGCVITTPNMNSWISRLLFPLGFHPVNYEVSTVRSSYGYRWLKGFKRQDWPVGHVRLFNTHSLRDMLRENQFVDIQFYGSIFEYMPKPLTLLDEFFSKFSSVSSGLIVFFRKPRETLT